jgi:hypothetical protein
MQECIGISVCLPLIIYNSFKFIIHFDMNKWYVMFFAAGRHHIVFIFLLYIYL